MSTKLITHYSSLFGLSDRRSFLLRIDPAVLKAVQRWADDDLRSLNGQIEFLLRRTLEEAGRARPRDRDAKIAKADEKSRDIEKK